MIHPMVTFVELGAEISVSGNEIVYGAPVLAPLLLLTSSCPPPSTAGNPTLVAVSPYLNFYTRPNGNYGALRSVGGMKPNWTRVAKQY